MTLAIVIAIAIAVSLALTPLAKALAWRFDLLSQPDGQRKLHSRPIPLLGGGSLYLAFLLSVTVAHSALIDKGITLSLPTGLALSAGMLCLLGIYDDLWDMTARWKLFGQVFSTLPIVLAGGYVERLVLFGYGVELGWVGIAFTMGWLVLGINALNLLDGMDGLASVVGIAISLSIAAIAASQNHPAAMVLSLALAGALAGFLVYNLPPARIYLGDSGSMIIGVALALLALRVSSVQVGTANFTIAATLLFVPLMDTALAIVRRSLQGNGLMVADRGHVHHRLLDHGFSIWMVLSFLGGTSLATGAIAWLVAGSGQEWWAWAILGTLAVLLVNRRLVGHEEWRLASRLFMQTAARLVRWPSSTHARKRFPAATAPPESPMQPVNEAVAMVGPALGQTEASPEERRRAA